ncbi:MAG: hypothetical protein ACRDZX_08745 [Acidimicrobiales bacterium]
MIVSRVATPPPGPAGRRPAHEQEPPRALSRLGACLALATAVALGLTGCSKPHLGLPVKPPVGLKNCFEDLPLAEAALNAPKGSYDFHGVKLVSPKVMAKLVKERFPDNPSSSYTPPPVGSKVCAFAFTGNFPAGQVAQAPAKVSGKAAVVLTTTSRKLLFSFVLTKLPENFGRPFT